MKLLFAASEGAPYIKTGGLGDVIYALPNELANDPENEIAIFLPYYRSVKKNPDLDIEYLMDFSVPLSWRVQYCGLFTAKGQKPNITYYFIDNDYYFDRPNCYGDFDDGERFAFFSKAVIESLLHLDFMPEVIHCHDWQTALIPLWLKACYSHLERFRNIKTVFTIHNIEYQGQFADSFFDECIGVNPYWFNYLSYDGCLNFMKSAIVLADKVTTVSRTYAYEIRHAYFAHGLQNIISQYGYKVTGVVNGIDTELYNAETDPKIFVNFKPGDLEGKTKNKIALQEKLGLPVAPDIPMVAMISRLASHKGLDLVEYVANDLMQMPIQFVVIGTGEDRYQNLFWRLAWEHPEKMSANIMFDPVLANQLYAAADLFLMPSQAEPCGLSQLIAMRYGTIPIVRETGGLFDTVPALNVETLEGRGFTFKSYNAHDMLDAVQRGVSFYENTAKRRQVMANLMNYDCSWKAPVQEYLAIYRSL